MTSSKIESKSSAWVSQFQCSRSRWTVSKLKAGTLNPPIEGRIHVSFPSQCNTNEPCSISCKARSRRLSPCLRSIGLTSSSSPNAQVVEVEVDLRRQRHRRPASIARHNSSRSLSACRPRNPCSTGRLEIGDWRVVPYSIKTNPW